MDQKVYYANCRLNGMTALLAGPFLEAGEAEEAMNLVHPIVIAQEPDTRKASFGVMECKAPGAGAGTYNHVLPERLMGGLAMLANLADKSIIMQ